MQTFRLPEICTELLSRKSLDGLSTRPHQSMYTAIFADLTVTSLGIHQPSTFPSLLSFLSPMFSYCTNIPFWVNPRCSFLSSYWFTQFPSKSQWEQMGWLAIPPCFVYKPRFSASKLLFLAAWFILVSYLAHFSALEMWVMYFPKMPIDFWWTKWCYMLDLFITTARRASNPMKIKLVIHFYYHDLKQYIKLNYLTWFSKKMQSW